jgi:hypothetical protein
MKVVKKKSKDKWSWEIPLILRPQFYEEYLRHKGSGLRINSHGSRNTTINVNGRRIWNSLFKINVFNDMYKFIFF